MSLGNAHCVPASKKTAGVWENGDGEGVLAHSQADGIFAVQEPRLGT